MATIAITKVNNTGATVTRSATTPGGDEFDYSGGGLLLLHFNNGHAASITVNFVPVKPTGIIAGAGPAPIPTRSVTIAAGADAVIAFDSSNSGAYINSSRRIPASYTTGNALLTVLALSA